MNENYLSILQNLAVNARQDAKEKSSVEDLNELKKLGYEHVRVFNVNCCEIIFNKIAEKTKLNPRLIEISLNNEIRYQVVAVSNLLIDPTIDYFIPTKQFAYYIKEYPIKIKNYKVLK